ncbi:hypothetical protein A2631_05570 [Candidatus Daviesbacteria bacterium RIFCSPHIGHO2_01_FULL_44_29]|uniref:Uncharacterized protein n=1 Tax=Candidatus Daviesbacteria bacterium RIFCSPHIGHO2_02_FULL_43_12 TaxID=1797776 RepID=A0A1F5KI16_9BACT|nr:MAG: hypothetical protein A2631_05570 [Candidatus Daviesbacteria bacterium RIFCSPHIGHO2_01_FULL_44_29]OGE39214.1 MAG: hypothetical protein A3E86_01315 [Candidatus Daviesbacteria bacterium RIFCSPHIGHO2_12_FULL_47_45]OGE40583.1 MAG: hypothetical protein A3D25_00495 [Candidatus Daviesbacteria bacterium RIFCSPHIGHO2_02_FULL_43_12]OGE70143.1 MAG: hypothetical protein A3B55_00265 [Candidatus Daviesbacteria bacterium RIFCSPLOWO2_01_FULL_43_15]
MKRPSVEERNIFDFRLGLTTPQKATHLARLRDRIGTPRAGQTIILEGVSQTNNGERIAYAYEALIRRVYEGKVEVKIWGSKQFMQGSLSEIMEGRLGALRVRMAGRFMDKIK